MFEFQNDVISCAQQVELLEQQLAARMEQLQATVQSKTAVPTAQVYVSTYVIFYAIHNNCHMPSLLLMYLVAYRPRSNCSQGSNLIRVHSLLQ